MPVSESLSFNNLSQREKEAFINRINGSTAATFPADGNTLTITPTGSESDIDINIVPKGNGDVFIEGQNLTALMVAYAASL